MRKNTKLVASIGAILLVVTIIVEWMPFNIPAYEWAGKETYSFLSDTSVTDKGNPLESIAWSPDGRWLATACIDGTIKILDGTSYLLKSTFHVDDPLIFSISWSTNSSWLASGGGLGISIWDVSKGNLVKFIDMNARQIHCVAFSPDGKRIATGSIDSISASSIRIWDAVDWTLQVEITQPAWKINQVVWLDNGNRLLSWARNDNQPTLWETSNGRNVVQYPYNPECSVSCSPDGKWLLYGNHYIVDSNRGVLQPNKDKILYHSDWYVYSSDWTDDGDRLAFATTEGIQIWDTTGIGKAHVKLVREPIDAGTMFHCIAWAPDAKRLAAGTYHGKLKILARDSDGDGAWDYNDAFPKVNDRPLYLNLSISAMAAIWLVLFAYIQHRNKNARFQPKS